MKLKCTVFILFIMACWVYGQKKPLDHSVYDSWQNIGARKISNDGKWISYSVDVQEGNSNLFYIQLKIKFQNSLQEQLKWILQMIPGLLFFRSARCIKISKR